eukprot:Seg4264.2 transcript_id=Seg4264.2/GoldUCD/mRNA.D3Y31 product="hypothetical protein" protein_id=Seg4264.2/GoldUCD/D3Y31
MDHNRHLNRMQLRRKDGSLAFGRRWGKRTKSWHAVIVPEPKTYPHIPDLIAKAMWRRHMDPVTVHETRVCRDATRLLPANIAAKPAPVTEDLVSAHVKRSTMKQAQI